MSSSRHGLIALRRHINLPFADGTTANIVMVDVRHHRYWRRFTARTVDNTGIGNSNRATARTERRSRLRQQARHDRRTASFGISCCFFSGKRSACCDPVARGAAHCSTGSCTQSRSACPPISSGKASLTRTAILPTPNDESPADGTDRPAGLTSNLAKNVELRC